jgi:hypothetical protein
MTENRKTAEECDRTYRVVGVRGDNSRIVLDEGLARHQADHLRELLRITNAFPSVDVELEGPTDAKEPDV